MKIKSRKGLESDVSWKGGSWGSAPSKNYKNFWGAAPLNQTPFWLKKLLIMHLQREDREKVHSYQYKKNAKTFIW